MKLRLILLVLALLAFLSTTVGGYLYYDSLWESAFQEAEQQAAIRVEMLRINLSTMISANIPPARVLASMPSIIDVLKDPSPARTALANATLDRFKNNLKVDVCYLMNRDGLTGRIQQPQRFGQFRRPQFQLSAVL